MTISIVNFHPDDGDDPTDAYWAVIERISLASQTYTNENAGPLHMASTLRMPRAVMSDRSSDESFLRQTG
jgi:hypothetical protein